jgi:xanthine dehydrogenase YagR molybdenum-binding subunit
MASSASLRAGDAARAARRTAAPAGKRQAEVIGKPLPRLDAVQKVTGAAHYVRRRSWGSTRAASQYPLRTRASSLDTAEAEKYPGGEPFTCSTTCCSGAVARSNRAGEPLPAVQYLGQPLAAVAADTQSRDAAALLVGVT